MRDACGAAVDSEGGVFPDDKGLAATRAPPHVAAFGAGKATIDHMPVEVKGELAALWDLEAARILGVPVLGKRDGDLGLLHFVAAGRDHVGDALLSVLHAGDVVGPGVVAIGAAHRTDRVATV